MCVCVCMRIKPFQQHTTINIHYCWFVSQFRFHEHIKCNPGRPIDFTTPSLCGFQIFFARKFVLLLHLNGVMCVRRCAINGWYIFSVFLFVYNSLCLCCTHTNILQHYEISRIYCNSNMHILFYVQLFNSNTSYVPNSKHTKLSFYCIFLHCAHEWPTKNLPRETLVFTRRWRNSLFVAASNACKDNIEIEYGHAWKRTKVAKTWQRSFCNIRNMKHFCWCIQVFLLLCLQS